jgi:hypothetical protein
MTIQVSNDVLLYTPIKVRLISVTGNELIIHENAFKNTNRFEMDVSNISGGMYILNLSGNSFEKKIKIIKL